MPYQSDLMYFVQHRSQISSSCISFTFIILFFVIFLFFLIAIFFTVNMIGFLLRYYFLISISLSDVIFLLFEILSGKKYNSPVTLCRPSKSFLLNHYCLFLDLIKLILQIFYLLHESIYTIPYKAYLFFMQEYFVTASVSCLSQIFLEFSKYFPQLFHLPASLALKGQVLLMLRQAITIKNYPSFFIFSSCLFLVDLGFGQGY